MAFIATLSVAVKKALIAAILTAMGHAYPVWCDSCGEVCESPNPEVITYTDHHGIEHTGPVCDYCETYWFEMEDSLRDA